MNTFDLGDLVFKIFKYLDQDVNINAKQTQPQEIIFQVTEFLKQEQQRLEAVPPQPAAAQPAMAVPEI